MKTLREYIDLIKEAQNPEWSTIVSTEVAARGLPVSVSAPGTMHREETWSYKGKYFGKSSENIESNIVASEEYGSYNNETSLDAVIRGFLTNNVSDLLVDYDTDEQERKDWKWEGANDEATEQKILKQNHADSVFEFVENVLPGHDDFEADYQVDSNIADITWSNFRAIFKSDGKDVKMTYASGPLTPAKPAASNDGTDYSMSGE